MSFDWDNLETPAKAFIRKIPEKESTVIDEQTGENIMQGKRRTNFGIQH